MLIGEFSMIIKITQTPISFNGELCIKIRKCVRYVFIIIILGERGGSVVEQRTPVRNLPRLCCVLEQDTLLPESTGNTQEAVLRPDMTEKLLTGTLSLNTNTQT